MSKNTKTNNQKIPVGMILLGIFLIWTTFKTIGNYFVRQSSLDSNLLAHYGLLYLSQIIFIPMIILNIFSIYAIFSRRRFGYKTLLSFFVLNIIVVLAMYLLSISNLDLFRDLALQSRMERGLTTDAINFATNPVVFGVVNLLIILFYLLLIYYVHKKRGYFYK